MDALWDEAKRHEASPSSTPAKGEEPSR